MYGSIWYLAFQEDVSNRPYGCQSAQIFSGDGAEYIMPFSFFLF
jgi:hypothetical protein